MATEKQIAANRQNAQRSTGPKTKAGKDKSRRNALKHGLAGEGVVLSAPDQKRVNRRLESFREKLAPVDELEEYLVTRIAMASVRAERAVERETDGVRRRVRRAARRWDQKQEQNTNREARLLDREPAAAVRGLKRSAHGCDWLRRQWLALGKALKQQGHWTHEQAAHAIRLLGKVPEACCCAGGRVARLRWNFLGALPEVDPEEAEAILGLDPEGLDEAARFEAISARLPEPEQARRVLRAIVLGQVRKLDQRAQRLWRHADGPDRQETLAIAQVDTTIEGVRLQRYESTHEMGVHRNLNELIKIRKQEPELASIARWEKQGKKYNRRWDGYSWVPNAEWVAGGGWRVAGGEERVAGGREGGSTEVEPSTVTGPDADPQATPRVAGFSAWREPGAPQPQLPPGDPDPMAQEPVSASLADAGVGDWGSGVGEGKTRTADGCPMTEKTAAAAPVSQPSSAIGHSASAPQPLTPNPQPLRQQGWPGSSARNEPVSTAASAGAISSWKQARAADQSRFGGAGAECHEPGPAGRCLTRFGEGGLSSKPGGVPIMKASNPVPTPAAQGCKKSERAK